MTGFLQAVIVLDWLLLIIGAIGFLVQFGRPSRYQDPPAARHLWVATIVLGLQPVAFILAGISLLPAAITETVSMTLLYIRWGLLSLAQREARRALVNSEEGTVGDA